MNIFEKIIEFWGGNLQLKEEVARRQNLPENYFKDKARTEFERDYPREMLIKGNLMMFVTEKGREYREIPMNMIMPRHYDPYYDEIHNTMKTWKLVKFYPDAPVKEHG